MCAWLRNNFVTTDDVRPFDHSSTCRWARTRSLLSLLINDCSMFACTWQINDPSGHFIYSCADCHAHPEHLCGHFFPCIKTHRSPDKMGENPNKNRAQHVTDCDDMKSTDRSSCWYNEINFRGWVWCCWLARTHGPVLGAGNKFTAQSSRLFPYYGCQTDWWFLWFYRHKI